MKWVVPFAVAWAWSPAAAAVSPNPKDLEIPSGELLRARALVARLGSEAFAEREASQAELARMGRLAGPVLRAAVGADADPEVRARVARLIPPAEAADFKARAEAFLADAEGKYDHDMPGWAKFRRASRVEFDLLGLALGTDATAARGAREMFVEMIRSKPTVALLTACERGGTDLAKAVGERRAQIWTEMHPGAFVGGLGGMRRVAPGPARQPTLPEVTALLFAESLLEGKSSARVGPFFVATSQFFHSPALSAALQGNGAGPHVAAFRRVLAEWFRHLADAQELQQVGHLVIQWNIKEALPAMRRAAVAPGMAVFVRAQALGAVARIGGREELATLKKSLDDEAAVQQNRFPGMDLQVRDVALAMSIVVSDQDPKQYGFDVQQPINDQIKYQYWTWAFASTAKRKAAFERWAAWEAKEKANK